LVDSESLTNASWQEKKKSESCFLIKMYQQNLHISETDCVEFKYFISMNRAEQEKKI
jgi:hypothetical protein